MNNYLRYFMVVTELEHWMLQRSISHKSQLPDITE